MNRKGFIVLVIMFIFLAPILGSCYALPSVQLSLVITPALNSVPSDGQQHPAFFVSVADNSGKPRILQSPINITISSSDNRILTVPNYVIMEDGTYYIIVQGSSKILEKKSVEVSASSSGLQSATTTISVEPPAGTPISLQVTLLPNVLSPSVGAESDVVVTIVDTYGKPAKARSDLIVTLTSSNLQIADVIPNSIQISKGEFSAMAKINTTGFVGSTSITASSSDLKSDTQTFAVSGPKPEKLVIWFPPYITTDTTGSIPVMITDNELRPAKLPFQVQVSLFSSNSSILSVQGSVTIDIEKWYALATITASKYITGSATIYASAENMASSNIVISVVRSVGAPKTLKIYSLATLFPADEISYTGLIVQSLNESGYPCKPNSPTTVNLFSTYSQILDAPPTATITKDSSMVYCSVVPKSPGNVKVNVAASNFEGTDAQFSVYEPTPSSVQVIVPPIPAGGEVLACLSLSSGGTPAPVQQDTSATLSSSNTKVAEVDSTAVLPKKSYYSLFNVKGWTPGNFFISTSGAGIPSGSISVQVYEVRPSNFFVSTIKPLTGTQFPIVAQIISSSGPPAVLDEPVQIKISSSNVTSISVPESGQIEADKSETLLYGNVTSSNKVSITIASLGFTSSSLQLDVASYKAGLKLISKQQDSVNSNVAIQAQVTLEGSPVSGVKVYWKGNGLQNYYGITGSDGNYSNILTLQHGQNIVEASAIIPGGGYIDNTTKVLGLNEYSLQVSSNIPADIDVSPGALKYKEGFTVTLTAPSTVGMDGVLGFLGGKYNFNQWTGFLNSPQNPVDIVFAGDSSTLTVKALYVEDLTMIYIWIIVIIVIVAIIVLFLFMRWRASRKPKEAEETEASITLGQSETVTETKAGKEKETGESKEVKEFPPEEKKDESVE